MGLQIASRPNPVKEIVMLNDMKPAITVKAIAALVAAAALGTATALTAVAHVPESQPVVGHAAVLAAAQLRPSTVPF
jgi:hypothetical protein